MLGILVCKQETQPHPQIKRKNQPPFFVPATWAFEPRTSVLVSQRFTTRPRVILRAGLLPEYFYPHLQHSPLLTKLFYLPQKNTFRIFQFFFAEAVIKIKSKVSFMLSLRVIFSPIECLWVEWWSVWRVWHTNLPPRTNRPGTFQRPPSKINENLSQSICHLRCNSGLFIANDTSKFNENMSQQKYDVKWKSQIASNK